LIRLFKYNLLKSLKKYGLGPLADHFFFQMSTFFFSRTGLTRRVFLTVVLAFFSAIRRFLELLNTIVNKVSAIPEPLMEKSLEDTKKVVQITKTTKTKR